MIVTSIEKFENLFKQLKYETEIKSNDKQGVENSEKEIELVENSCEKLPIRVRQQVSTYISFTLSKRKKWNVQLGQTK